MINVSLVNCGKRLQLKQVVATGRYISSSSIRSDMLSWFRSNKNKAGVPVEKTSDVISKIEQDGGVSAVDSANKSSENFMKLSPENFIGEDIGVVSKRFKDEVIQGMPFNSWLSTVKVNNEIKFNDILVNCYNETVLDNEKSISDINDTNLQKEFDDLVTKFKFTKSLQAKSGYLIPDYLLTTLNTPMQYKTYYMNEIFSGKQQRFKESEPNAIHLTNDSFSSKNIRVVEDVTPKLQIKKKNKVLSELHLSNAQSTTLKIQNSTNE